jgi:hypothetical protein
VLVIVKLDVCVFFSNRHFTSLINNISLKDYLEGCKGPYSGVLDIKYLKLLFRRLRPLTILNFIFRKLAIFFPNPSQTKIYEKM